VRSALLGGRAGVDRGRHHPVQGVDPKGSLWVGNGVQNISGGLVLLPFALMFSNVGDIAPGCYGP
jgi:hypothetical protein